MQNQVVENSRAQSEEYEDVYGGLEYCNVNTVVLGDNEFDTWYGNSSYFFSNEPSTIGWKTFQKGIKIPHNTKKLESYTKEKKPWIDKLFVCDSCFSYSTDEKDIKTHKTCCKYKIKFPGKLMYHDGEYSIRKVKGSRHKLFCQSMSMFAKFFLDNKSVFFALDYFDFYIIYGDVNGFPTPMGFFSKELLSWESNNLACILVFPPFQRRGLGNILISFSYELSKAMGTVSGPEHPLSPFGKKGYLSYWSKTIAREILVGQFSTSKHITLEILSTKIGIRPEDIIMALDHMDSLYERGEKDIFTEYHKDSERFIALTEEGYDLLIVKSNIKKWVIDNKVTYQSVIDPANLILS
ncbi:hypothetical protein BVG19_g370 [[Candida] boidinii]|nr:hypothetical protein BVG19_g370 [[Candida] boidinii]OWB49559.1 hypothetical protein B5S27_g1100 [[Candida] boidinii]OWB81898.1 hypothetical protein B5S33_g518 [[Candida] boidinii]